MSPRWLGLAVLAWLCSRPTFAVQDEPRQKVQTTTYLEAPVGVPQLGREEWAAFLRDNLDVDLQPWKARAPLHPADIPVQHAALVNATGMPEPFQLILIYNNRIYYPNRTDVNNTEPPYSSCAHGLAFFRKVSALLASGRRTLPNVLFVYSFEDNRPRFCAPSSEHCRKVPLLSQIKTLGEPDGDDLDLLIPQWFYTPNSLYLYPWHLKKDLAFFRGEPFCSFHWVGRYHCHDACPRTALAQLAQRDRLAGNATVLDVGILERMEKPVDENGEDAKFSCIKMDIPVSERVAIPEHSYYKWLIHMEGITASSRLSQLMLVNSVVVMQRQPFIEYFYRSLKPDVHYVPFFNKTDSWFMDDIYGVIRDLRKRDEAEPEEVQRIVREAQEFAIKYTMPASRFQYLREALEAFKGLFPTMDIFLEGYVSGLRQRGFSIE